MKPIPKGLCLEQRGATPRGSLHSGGPLLVLRTIVQSPAWNRLNQQRERNAPQQEPGIQSLPLPNHPFSGDLANGKTLLGYHYHSNPGCPDPQIRDPCFDVVFTQTKKAPPMGSGRIVFFSPKHSPLVSILPKARNIQLGMSA